MIRLRLIVRLLVEIAGLIRDMSERQRAKGNGRKATRPRASVPAIEHEIDALIAELRELDAPKRKRWTPARSARAGRMDGNGK